MVRQFKERARSRASDILPAIETWTPIRTMVPAYRLSLASSLAWLGPHLFPFLFIVREEAQEEILVPEEGVEPS